MGETTGETMRAARLHYPDRVLRVEDVPKPVPGAGEVLVRVAAAGVCLSDVHLIDGTLTGGRYRTGDSVVLGHEVAGTVAALGPGVAGWQEGDRVVLQAGEHRGEQLWTRGVDYDGGWAEYALASVGTLTALPGSIPFEQAAIIPDAVSTPWGAITETGAVRPAEAVGVWGVGGLGAHGVQLLRAVGAYPVIAVDPEPVARERAIAFGADEALDPGDPDFAARVAGLTGGQGLRAAFDFAGVEAVRAQALRVLGVGGRLVLVGLTGRPLHIEDSTGLSFLRQQVLGHYGSGDDAVGQLVGLTAGGRLDFSRSVTDVLPLEDVHRAVERMHTKEGSPIRLVLRP
ncbi:zinc-binding dehydrogenase [Streptomyces sp. RFCAC02]|uniref:zinc-binding dehydrogenase n=1 Tax=Streptomyces sp. RFCAC02 TaxID=2499143 RepID=UPI0010208A87|nr:zinc-binding dehydrogenase [Streptomyces sp. RFCAC02]